MNYAQDYEVHCEICGKPMYSPVKHDICPMCLDPETSTLVDYIVKLKKLLADSRIALSFYDSSMREGMNQSYPFGQDTEKAIRQLLEEQ
jgi:hypothetical protein